MTGTSMLSSNYEYHTVRVGHVFRTSTNNTYHAFVPLGERPRRQGGGRQIRLNVLTRGGAHAPSSCKPPSHIFRILNTASVAVSKHAAIMLPPSTPAPLSPIPAHDLHVRLDVAQSEHADPFQTRRSQLDVRMLKIIYCFLLGPVFRSGC